MLLALGSPSASEVIARSGVDWLFLDLEHSCMDAAIAQSVLQAVGGRVPSLVRVASRDEQGVRRALDIGADGIIFPMVNSAGDARLAVSLAKYPPDGVRGAGLGRAAGFGLDFQAYVERANRETAVVVQIEHVDGVNSIEEVLDVPGVDCVFVGPYDLSGSMGRLGATNHPDVTAAIARVTAACRSRRTACGIFAPSAAAARELSEDFSLLAIGSDALVLGRAMAEEIAKLKDNGVQRSCAR